MSMRCAGPGSWTKVVHLPTYLPRTIQCFSLVHARLGIRTRLRRVSERGASLRRSVLLSRMETSSSMMPRNPSGDFLSRARRSRSRGAFRKRSSRNWRSPSGCGYCNECSAARYRERLKTESMHYRNVHLQFSNRDDKKILKPRKEYLSLIFFDKSFYFGVLLLFYISYYLFFSFVGIL